jgi:hypothetical protein
VPSWQQFYVDQTCPGIACFDWLFAEYTSAISQLAALSDCSFMAPRSRASADIQSDGISIYANEAYTSLNVNARGILYDPIFWTVFGIAYSSGDPCQYLTTYPPDLDSTSFTIPLYLTHNSCYCASSISELVKESITLLLATEYIISTGSLSGSLSTILSTQWIDSAISLYEDYCGSINSGVTYPIATGNATYALAPISTSQVSNSTANSNGTVHKTSAKSGLSTGAKLGIGLGVPLGLAVLVVLVIVAVRAGLIPKLGHAHTSNATGDGVVSPEPMSPTDMAQNLGENTIYRPSPGTGVAAGSQVDPLPSRPTAVELS